jgi:glucosamine--fructose-6-phosphate aminotransferase (isomerizing)
MTDPGAWMAEELRESPAAVRRQGEVIDEPLGQLVTVLKSAPPRVVVTCARGSSAHAATFGKHLIERYLGFAVAEAAPSIVSVYGQQLQLDGQLFLAISQSGRSHDLLAASQSARAAGARTVAIVNDADSPLAASCEFVLPIAAGTELSVSATKTFVATLAALLRLTACWTAHDGLKSALDRLPDRLALATALDWSAAIAPLAAAGNLAIIGRGPTLAIAREAALKLKETCNLNAEAFSGAEFLHGPVALVSPAYPIMMLWPTDEAAPGMSELAIDLRRRGGTVWIAEHGSAAPFRLATLAPDHPAADAVCLIQSFYALAVAIAGRRGTSADKPRHLQKITLTR